jgi:hypothetical protein
MQVSHQYISHESCITFSATLLLFHIKNKQWGGDNDSQVDVVLHQSHPGVSGPALLVVVAHNVLIVGVRVLR